MNEIHRDALTPELQQLWSHLPSLPEFYLAGGTALALQLGHRVSVDLDFFAYAPIDKNLWRNIESIFRNYDIELLVNNSEELSFLASQVKLTYLHYPFPRLRELVNLDHIQALDILELSASKAYTIGRRGEFKDYVDLYFAISSGVTLEGIINLAVQKYQKAFNTRLFLEQLVYLDDVETIDLVFLKQAVDKSVMSDFFSQQINSLRII